MSWTRGIGTRLRMCAIACVGSGWAVGCTAATREEGVRIGDTTLEQMEPGVTTEAWLVAILGEPTSFSAVEGLPDTKVFRYSLGEKSGGLASMVTGSSGKNKAVVYFLLTEGVMTRYWADREVEQPLIGGPRMTPGGEKQ